VDRPDDVTVTTRETHDPLCSTPVGRPRLSWGSKGKVGVHAVTYTQAFISWIMRLSPFQVMVTWHPGRPCLSFISTLSPNAIALRSLTRPIAALSPCPWEYVRLDFSSVLPMFAERWVERGTMGVTYTGSRPITEVKWRRARLVLGWVTAWPRLIGSIYSRVVRSLIPFTSGPHSLPRRSYRINLAGAKRSGRGVRHKTYDLT